MNELIAHNKNLPDTMQDLSRFVLFGREKYNSIRAEIRAIEKLQLAEEVRNQKRQEAQMLAEALLDAEVRLGELFRQIPKASNQYKSAVNNDVNGTNKKEVLVNLGFSQMQANRLETLADNPDLVECVKAEARESDGFPTRARILKLAANNNKQSDKIVGEIEEYDKFLDLRVNMYKKLGKIIELIDEFEITPHNMDALRDNFDAVLRIDEEINYINEAIDKLNRIKSELWKGKDI